MHLFNRRLFGAVASVVVLAACGSTNAPSSGGVTTISLKVMVGGLNKQIYLPNMLAQRLGYFKDQHLDVTLIDEGSGQASEEEVVAGNVDAGSGAYVHPMVLNTQGKKIETICVTVQHHVCKRPQGQEPGRDRPRLWHARFDASHPWQRGR